MLAVENSTYGRVADVHSLLPGSGLHIVDEAFVRVHINLLARAGHDAGSRSPRRMAMRCCWAQCRDFLKDHDLAAR